MQRHEQKQADIRPSELRIQADEKSQIHSDGRDTGGNQQGDRSDTGGIRKSGSGGSEEVLPDMVAVPERMTEVQIARHQLEQANKSLARYQLAYHGIVAVHASLMLSVYTPEGIRDILDGEYYYALTKDCSSDIRGALNIERKRLEKLQSRFKQ